MRDKIAVTNYDKSGRVTPGKWYVRIGATGRTFTQAEWESKGIPWIQEKLAGG